jgi:archaeal flagellar protein FlaJ
MKQQRIPFLPFSPTKAKVIARHYLGWGEKVESVFHRLPWELEQARLDFEAREWAAIAFYSMIMYFFVVFDALFIILLIAKVQMNTALALSMLTGMGFSMGVFMFQIFYPKLYVSRKIKEVERNLPYVLHHLLIHIRSGVPLFNALVSVAKSNYGVLSKEFQHTITEINTGKSEVAALEMLARENPSIYLRRVMWQIVNAMKSGADIGVTLKEIVDNMMEEEKTDIKKYGSELNPMALFYMMLVVIFPTLGIIFLLVLFSFVGAAMNLELIMIGILLFVIIFQFMFIGMIKSKRPVGI